MSSFTLKQIILTNFKLFGGKFTVNFGKDRLVVFDGPNGYGKTSVFDGIELALTGTISRLHNIENRKAPSDIVVANNNSKEVEIKVVLENSVGEMITVIRRLKDDIPKDATKIKEFPKLWDCFIEKNGLLEIADDLDSLLGTSILNEYYKLFHYVRQEDTAFFLKNNNEKDRATQISSIIGNTTAFEDKEKRIDAIVKRINELIKHKGDLLNAIPVTDKKSVDIGGQENTPEYHKLIKWVDADLEIDYEYKKGLSKEKEESLLFTLEGLQAIHQYRDIFKNDHYYQKVATQRSFFKSFLLNFKHIHLSDELEKKLEQKRLLGVALQFLQEDKLEDIEKECKLEELFSIIKYDQGEDFIRELRSCLKELNDIGGAQKLILQMNEYRSGMTDVVASENYDSCPLCGNEFESTNRLLEAIQKHGNTLEILLSDVSQRVASNLKRFKEDYLLPVRGRVEKLNIILPVPPKDNYDRLKDSMKNRERFEKLCNWFAQQNISYSDLLYDDINAIIPELEVEERLDSLEKRIRTLVGDLPNDYLESNEKYAFNVLFKNYLDEKYENLNLLTEDAIQQKMQFLQHSYLSGIDQNIQRRKTLNDQLKSLEEKKARLNKIKTIIARERKKYLKKLIKEIEIPFYLYTGKILQTHQAGLGSGIFFKNPANNDDLQNLKLVSDMSSDHDILNTMSSGQIAAVVIALTLTLNKVYAKGLNTILIDDPVQTMDDINMISFVELLRNEFADQQIILSTHEEETSRYLLYKFLKHGHSVRKINLMERKEYQLTN